MTDNCAIIPKVTNKNGQKVDSKLFTDLLSYTNNNRSLALETYLRTKNPDFIEFSRSRLVFDDNNEPTIKSLLEKTNLEQIISEKNILEKLNRDIGYYKKGMNRPALWVNNDENYHKLVKKAFNFNQNSPFRDKYVARVIQIPDTESPRIFIGVKVMGRNRRNSIDAEKMAYNYSLNERLKEILTSHGISIGALTELEKRMKINGVTDFDVARNAATGFIELIRLANGIQGEKALPEEFAHFAIKAMGNSPLINRLLNHISSNGLVSEILGDEYNTYSELYNGDTVKMAEEAAGKLLAKHLLNAQPIEQKSYKNLLQRIIEAVKAFFRKLNPNQIQKAMNEANHEFSRLASDILEGNMDQEMDIKNISSSDSFYQIDERIQRDKKLLNEIIKNEQKRLEIYKKRNPKGQFDAEQRLLIDKLLLSLENNNNIEGIYTFLETALNELQKISKRFVILKNTPAPSLNETAGVLRNIKNYISSYKNILSSVREALLEEEQYSDNRYGERVRIAVDKVSNLISDLEIEYENYAIPVFSKFIKPFIGNISDEQLKILLTQASKDISFFDRYLDSMSDSSDQMIRVMDNAIKKSKHEARLRTLDLIKKLQAATIKLEQSGIKDTSWMFERDSNGNLTGFYISEINHALYEEKKRTFLASLNERYGSNPIGEDALKYNAARRAWFEQNLEIINGKKQPKLSIYGSKEFQKLNSAQKEYYKTVMDIKEKLDSFLPDRYSKFPLKAIRIRKDLIERLKSSDNVKSGTKQLWESIKDTFIERGDDTDFGTKSVVKDFEGNQVQTLPIYFTQLKEGERINDISTDIVSTMSAYASMAINYDEMGKVLDLLELGRDILRRRKVTQTQGGKSLVERFKSVGQQVTSKLTKENEATRIIQRLNDAFDMQVYGRYMKDEGTFGKSNISIAKTANFVNKMTVLSDLALSLLSGIANVLVGKVQMRIESLSKEFFTEKNTIKADRIYSKELFKFLGELGNRVKISKLALWDEKFDVMQDYDTKIMDMNFDRKTWFSRMLNSNSLFFLQHSGEHWMQNRTSLALADAYKMKSPNGKTVSLWDAMEVVPIDNTNKKLGAKLQIKKGYTKLDGTEFTREDEIKFSRKSAAINERMHGIYNKADKAALHRLSLGRMGLLFRNWIKASLNRRFKSAAYNYDLEADTEGYYRTALRFMGQLLKDLRQAQFHWVARFNELDSTEKANIRRVITEVGHFILIATVLGLLNYFEDDDDKEKPWALKMIEYQARRLYTELGALIPGLQMKSEGLKILKEPAAGLDTIEDASNLIKLLNPFNYTDEIESGRYKGHSTAYKALFESPLVPMYKTVFRAIHPEHSLPFYRNNF